MPKGGRSKPTAGETEELGDDNFESIGSGAANFTPKQCSALRKNEFVLIKDKPCKIVEMSTSKTGKHGHAKVHMVGIDIFDGKKYEDICPSTHNVSVPLTKNTNYVVTDIDEEGYVCLMDDCGLTKEDLKIEENATNMREFADIFKKAQCEEHPAEYSVTVVSAMGKEQIQSYKVINK